MRVKWCIALRRYDVFRFAQNDVAPLRSAMMRCLPKMWLSHTSSGEAVIIGEANIICRRQTSFKKRTFVGRQKCVFCWRRMGYGLRRIPRCGMRTQSCRAAFARDALSSIRSAINKNTAPRIGVLYSYGGKEASVFELISGIVYLILNFFLFGNNTYFCKIGLKHRYASSRIVTDFHKKEAPSFNSASQ